MSCVSINMFHHRISSCYGTNGMLTVCIIMCNHTHTGRGHAYTLKPTIESRSMNGRGQAGQQVLCWQKIRLLSTSAFLNTPSYLPSPQEERSFLFSFVLGITVLSPTLHFCFPLLLHPFLPSHLSTPLLSFYILPPFIFSSLLLFFLFFPPLFSSLSSHFLLIASYALSGTAHSATKQSCLQHRTLVNQARPELSSPQIHSTTP